MDKAKAAVSSFVSRSGKHDTTVDESVAPAVVNEQIKPTRHENVQQAVDREVHQDHYHTTVQPIQHRDIKPETHHHQMAPVQEKKIEHGNENETRSFLEREAAKFKDVSIKHETKHTTAAAPTVEGEHVHHHVHENVQPVIHRETIVPEVIHTTVPIHEVHHASVQHHGTSVLPMKTLSEFSSGGGIVEGAAKVSHGSYDGCPRPYNEEMQTGRTDADHDPHAGHHHGLGGNHHTSGPHSSDMANKTDPRVDSDRDGRTGLGGRSGINGTHHGGTDNTPVGATTGHRHGSDSSSSSSDRDRAQRKKPSLMDKLNPKKDTDEDGKTGIMD